MAIDYTFMAKRIQNLEVAYVLFAVSTKQPFIECDPEDFDDQVYLFAEEEAAKEAAKAYGEKQMPLAVVKVGKKQMPMFFTSLPLLGVNMLVFHDGAGTSHVPVDQIVKLDPKVNEKKDIPFINASLQLTVIYFNQELRRPNQKKDDKERMKRLQELEEEMIANLVRSRFILAIDVTNVQGEFDPKKPNPGIQIPYVKTPNGDIFQPIFSDVWEFQKFQKNPNAKLRMAAVPFKGLLPALVNQAKGFVLNPNGVNLILSREQLAAIAKRFEE